jgi:hypothetical protein
MLQPYKYRTSLIITLFMIRRIIRYTLRTPNSERATQNTFITYSHTILQLYVSEFVDYEFITHEVKYSLRRSGEIMILG